MDEWADGQIWERGRKLADGVVCPVQNLSVQGKMGTQEKDQRGCSAAEGPDIHVGR